MNDFIKIVSLVYFDAVQPDMVVNLGIYPWNWFTLVVVWVLKNDVNAKIHLEATGISRLKDKLSFKHVPEMFDVHLVVNKRVKKFLI